MCCLVCRPEILKQEIKVFFVKYNDPIYVKLEKLDIMIRLASQANIAQVPNLKCSYVTALLRGKGWGFALFNLVYLTFIPNEVGN